jgi:NADPH:quinone reductase-like Zn-dependent oxidoreductase
MPVPTTMKAYVAGDRSLLERGINVAAGKGTGPGASVKTIDVPTISSTEVLVKIHSVSLNPTDWKHIDLISPVNSIIGCDYSGTVAQVGTAVTNWKVGERIAGVAHGGLFPDKGVFAEYAKIEADLAWKIPDSVSFEDASTYGISPVTGLLGLYLSLDVPWPDEEAKADSPKEILIYAGSTTAGLAAISMAKLSGLKVVTTASPHNFDLVKSYGAEAAFDYKSETVVKDITTRYPHLTRAMDCISEEPSISNCVSALAASGGKVVILLQGSSKPSNVEVIHILM